MFSRPVCACGWLGWGRGGGQGWAASIAGSALRCRLGPPPIPYLYDAIYYSANGNTVGAILLVGHISLLARKAGMCELPLARYVSNVSGGGTGHGPCCFFKGKWCRSSFAYINL